MTPLLLFHSSFCLSRISRISAFAAQWSHSSPDSQILPDSRTQALTQRVWAPVQVGDHDIQQTEMQGIACQLKVCQWSVIKQDTQTFRFLGTLGILWLLYNLHDMGQRSYLPLTLIVRFHPNLLVLCGLSGLSMSYQSPTNQILLRMMNSVHGHLGHRIGCRNTVLYRLNLLFGFFLSEIAIFTRIKRLSKLCVKPTIF